MFKIYFFFIKFHLKKVQICFLFRQSFSKEEEHIRNTYRMFHHQEEVKDNYCIDLPPELANLQRYFQYNRRADPTFEI